MRVMTRAAAERYQPGPGDVCVSISDPAGSPADLSPAFAAVLRLAFDDLERPSFRDDVPFARPHAAMVRAFIRTHPGAAHVIVHCNAGASRSPGLALGISDWLGWPTREMEERHPGWNRRVRRIMGEPPSTAGRFAAPVTWWRTFTTIVQRRRG